MASERPSEVRFSVSEGSKAGGALFGGAFSCVAVLFWLTNGIGPPVLLCLAGAALGFSTPGDIVVDADGIVRERFWLARVFRTRIAWSGIDSAWAEYRPTESEQMRLAVVVSGGLDDTIEFTSWHVGVEDFLAALRACGVPIGGVSGPEGWRVLTGPETPHTPIHDPWQET